MVNFAEQSTARVKKKIDERKKSRAENQSRRHQSVMLDGLVMSDSRKQFHAQETRAELADAGIDADAVQHHNDKHAWFLISPNTWSVAVWDSLTASVMMFIACIP